MMRVFVLLALAATLPVDAARAEWIRCRRACYHTVAVRSNWAATCYQCHSAETGHYEAPAPAAEPGTGIDDTWRQDLLRVAEARDRYEAEIRRSQQEHAEFLAEVEKLGLTGSFQAQAVSVASAHGLGQYADLGQQGSTVYGYQAFAESFSTVDLAALYEQAGRLASQAQELSGQASGDFAALVSAAGENQARVAEILAKGHVAAAVLTATAPSPAPAQFRTFAFSARVDPAGRVDVRPLAVGGLGRPVVERSCIRCHGPQKQAGGLDLSSWPSVSPEVAAAVAERINSTDPAKVMPRTPDGKPAPLPWPDRSAILGDVLGAGAGAPAPQSSGP